eukprot:768679-Hanusia_phi.AAC.1
MERDHGDGFGSRATARGSGNGPLRVRSNGYREREREGQRKRGREGGSNCANDTMWLEIVIQGLEFKISDGWP